MMRCSFCGLLRGFGFGYSSKELGLYSVASGAAVSRIYGDRLLPAPLE